MKDFRDFWRWAGWTFALCFAKILSVQGKELVIWTEMTPVDSGVVYENVWPCWITCGIIGRRVSWFTFCSLQIKMLNFQLLCITMSSCIQLCFSCYVDNGLNLWKCKPAPINCFLYLNCCGHGYGHLHRNKTLTNTVIFCQTTWLCSTHILRRWVRLNSKEVDQNFLTAKHLRSVIITANCCHLDL